MNNLQSNERHLADKLRNVPVPDVDSSWEKMRRLLDRDMPEGAAGWSGNKKWWWMGITAGIIMVAVWLTQQLNDSRDERLANKEAAGNTVPVQTTPSGPTNATDNKTDNKTASARNDKIATQQVQENDQHNDITSTGNDDQSTSPVNNKQVQQKSAAIDQQKVSNEGSEGSITAKNDDQPVKTNDKKKIIQNEQKSDVTTRGYIKNNNTRNNMVSPEKKSESIKSETKDGLATARKNDLQDKAGEATNAFIEGKDGPGEDKAAGIASIEGFDAGKVLIENDPITSPASIINDADNNTGDAKAVPGKTDRAFAREMRQQSMKEDDRKMSRSSMRGNFGEKDHEITFAAGLTIPQSFAIGNQQASAYNVSARTGRLPDYLPAPFFQYHINTKLFLQTELHFQSPQYTDRLLLSRSTVDPSPTSRLEKNVYLEKLYYFNVPFNVYYSPARNFFIGSGLQYSSLLSGVASFEEKRTDGQNPVSYTSITRRFKDDSVAAKFAPSEWRYQFDANYYFKRFTLGLRYNQAMRDFVNLRANSALPVTQDRNRSFLLYLRFNIWEERKKGGYYSAYNW